MPTSETPTEMEILRRIDLALEGERKARELLQAGMESLSELYDGLKKQVRGFPAELAAARRAGMEECLRIVANWDSSGKSWNDLVKAIRAAAAIPADKEQATVAAIEAAMKADVESLNRIIGHGPEGEG